jgi:hypothetical protein
MGFRLSDEQKRRIEQEEKVRLAEEQHRAAVRERLISGEPEPRRSSRGKKFLILLIVIFVAYVWIKSH